MFQVLKGALESSLAPDIPLVDDFKHHWNLFLEFYSSNPSPLTHKSQPIEKTNLIFHLNKMLKLLIEEQNDVQNGSLGSCMEFLISNEVLDILSTLCQADVPPGIRPYIYKLFIFVLKNIKQPVIPYIDVYRPIRRLLMLCASCKASPTESQESLFLAALIRRMKDKPEYLVFFAHSSPPEGDSRSDSRRTSRSSSFCEIDWRSLVRYAAPSCVDNQNLLLSALLNYIDSSDYLIACKAMEGILTLSSLPDSEAARNGVESTPFGVVIASRLKDLFQQIPRSKLKPSDISGLRINWIEAHFFHSSNKETIRNLPGCSEVVSYLAWLDYVDSLIKSSHPIISESLTHHIKKDFLENSLELLLISALDKNIDDMIILVSLISLSWSHIHSQTLGKTYSDWLIGDSELVPNSHRLKYFFVEMLNSPDFVLASEAVNLFDYLLERPSADILDCLILSSIKSRGYYNFALAESQMMSWSEEEDEREKVRTPEETKKYRYDRGKTPPSRTLAPSNIHRIINCWLYLVSSEIRLKVSHGGYETYLSASTDAFLDIRNKCDGFDWPLEATGDLRFETESSDSRTEADSSGYFFEGEFFSAILNLLKNCLNQEKALNLKVTSVLSKLALCPHPYLHEYVLNPTLPLVPGTRTTFTVLKEVCALAKTRLEALENPEEKLRMCRQSLSQSAEERIESTGISYTELRLLDGIIVVEEFCKELAAIAFAKYTNSC